MFVFAVILAAQPSDGVGVIRGLVLYADGMPVNQARVLAGIPGAPQGGIARYVETDPQGNFIIDRLRFGDYAVYASKEDEGYQDPRWFSDLPLSRVILSAEQPLGRVEVTLGSKAGIITGIVRDAVTGKPLLPVLSANEWKLDIKLTRKRDTTVLTKIVIPEGYRGSVRLRCGMEGQPAMSQEDGRVVYRIGDDGSLRTSSSCPDRPRITITAITNQRMESRGRLPKTTGTVTV